MKVYLLILYELTDFGESDVWVDSVHSSAESAVNAGAETGAQRFFVQENILDGGRESTWAEFYRNRVGDIKLYKGQWYIGNPLHTIIS